MLGRRGTLITSTMQPPVGLACRSRWRWRKSGESAGSALAVLRFSFVSVVAESYKLRTRARSTQQVGMETRGRTMGVQTGHAVVLLLV
jgi:hypothetical protein